MVVKSKIKTIIVAELLSFGLIKMSFAQEKVKKPKSASKSEASAQNDTKAKSKKSGKSDEKDNDTESSKSFDPLNAKAWYDRVASDRWVTSKGIATRVYMDLESDQKELKTSFDDLDSRIQQNSSFQFTNAFDLAFTDRLNLKPPASPEEDKNGEAEKKEQDLTDTDAVKIDPFQGAITVDIAIKVSDKNAKAEVRTKNDTKASWKFPKVLLKKPQLLPAWIEKNLSYHGVVLDYKKPYVLIRTNRNLKAKANTIIYFGTSETIFFSKKDIKGMALARPQGESTQRLFVAKIAKVKGKLPKNLIGSKVKLLYPKSKKKK